MTDAGDMLFADTVAGVTDVGEKEQVIPRGSGARHVSVTGFEKAPCAVDATAIE